jgi:hypothetical protein
MADREEPVSPTATRPTCPACGSQYLNAYDDQAACQVCHLRFALPQPPSELDRLRSRVADLESEVCHLLAENDGLHAENAKFKAENDRLIDQWPSNNRKAVGRKFGNKWAVTDDYETEFSTKAQAVRHAAGIGGDS